MGSRGVVRLWDKTISLSHGRASGGHWRQIASCIGLLLAMLAGAPQVSAQEPQISIARGWTPAGPIPDYYLDTLPPVMVTDSNRTVHALVMLPLDEPSEFQPTERGIFYRQWTLANGWTEPLDIMLAPIKLQARVKAAFLDDAGVIHMVFFGGDEQLSNIYYSSAPAALAGTARAWTAPLPIGPNPITPDVALITGDGGDNLVMIYSGNLGEGNSLYAVYSEDAGVNWSEPELIFSTYTLTNKVFDINLHHGESGKVHVAWNVTDFRGQNVAGYYARMNDFVSRRWSEPKIIAPSLGLGFATPNLIEHQGTLIILYNNGLEGQVAPVIWSIVSEDGGETFSNPVRPFPNHVGRNGPPSLVVDGNGALHAFFGQRIPGGFDGTIDLHGMWHAVWNNFSWGPVTPVVTGPPVPGFDPYDATAVVSQGNTILLTWRTDPGSQILGIFYAYHVLDAPEAPVVALPVPPIVQQSATQTAAAAISQIAEATSMPASPPLGDPVTVTEALPAFSRESSSTSANNPAWPVVGALVPTVLFVVVALLIGNGRRRA